MVNDYLAYCKSGYVKITISKPGRSRTTGQGSQSHAINGFIAQLSNATGQDFETVKMAMKKMSINRGYPFRTEILTGEVIPYSETEIDTIQAGYLIDTIKQFASEYQIILKE